MSESSIEIVTFGCRLNSYESEVMKSRAAEAGIKNAVIFNTCAVTKESERQARQAIRRAGRNNPDAMIIVTGCSAQIDSGMYSDMKEVDFIIGNDRKLKKDTWQDIAANISPPAVGDIMEVEDIDIPHIDGFEGRARAFVRIQTGCDHRCTFCIIPFGRGKSRSVPIDKITGQVRSLVKNGYNEVVFTGVDISSYGADLPGRPSLGQMIKRVLALVPELPWLRLSSIDPASIDNDLWWLLENEKRLVSYLHLSIQSGDDMILKRMKRRHSRDDVVRICERARALRPEIALGADIIAGFPTESGEMFKNTLELVKDCGIVFPHVFPYSERQGTPAARMPMVSVEVRKQRAEILRDIGKKNLYTFLNRFIDKELHVIVEKGNIGRTSNFLQVRLDIPCNSSHGDTSQPAIKQGGLVKAKLYAIDEGYLVGKVV